MPNNGAAGNSHRPFSFDGAMKFEHHHCSQRQAPVAVPELTSEVIRQRFFQDLFTGFLKGLLPSSTRSKSFTRSLPFRRSAAS